MKKNPLMNGWQKVLYQLRKKWYQLRKNKREYSTLEEIMPNDVDGFNQIASIPMAKRYFSKQSPIPYWQQDFYYHDFV